MNPQGKWPILAHPLVHWLLSQEQAVRAYVNLFIQDTAPAPRVDVAGPPTKEDMEKWKTRDKDGAVELPTVTLHFEKKFNLIDGLWGVKIGISDEHLQELQRWHLRWSLGNQTETSSLLH